MSRKAFRNIAVSVLLLSMFVVQTTLSCPVCYADPDSPTSNALSYAIAALLGVTGTVLGGFVGLFVYLRQRAKKMTLNDTVDFPSLN